MPKDEPRLATRITHDNDKRLRMTAGIRRVKLRVVLDELLGAHLPSAGQLADQMREGEGTDDDSIAS